jgi:hypothetical protein
MHPCSLNFRGLLRLLALGLWVAVVPEKGYGQLKVNLDSVRVIARQRGLQTLPLYHHLEAQGEPSIGNFYALKVYEEGLGSEIWFTASPCLQVTATNFGDTGEVLRLQWDKLSEGCPPWMGLGIGWDDWSPKNMSEILHQAALYLRLRALKGPGKGLPLAFALEDYAGAQCWLGYQPKYLRTAVGPGLDTSAWSELVLPLEDFEWDRSNARSDNIKQLILQFEARGSVLLDEIRWIPYTGHPPVRWTGPWLEPGGRLALPQEEGWSVWRGRELRLSGSMLDWQPGQWTFGVAPEPAVWKRSPRLSDVTVHSSQFQSVEGQSYRRLVLPSERHPGFRPNATYYASYRPDAAIGGDASAEPVVGTLQFLTQPEGDEQ